MAFDAITAAEIAAGKPNTNPLWEKVRGNDDDFESRLADVETAVISQQPLQFDVLGQGQIGDGKLFIRVPFNITVTDVKLFIWEAGSVGTTTVDVELATVAAGAFNTILSAPISAAFGTGDQEVVSAASVVTTSIDAGTFLRLNIDSIQTGATGYSVLVEFNVRTS